MEIPKYNELSQKLKDAQLGMGTDKLSQLSHLGKLKNAIFIPGSNPKDKNQRFIQSRNISKLQKEEMQSKRQRYVDIEMRERERERTGMTFDGHEMDKRCLMLFMQKSDC